MKIMLLEDLGWNLNDSKYFKGQVFRASESKMFASMYAIYHQDTLDWIPKEKARVFEED